MLDNLYLAIAKHKEKTGKKQGKIGLEAGITETRLSMIIYQRVEATSEERTGLSRVLDIAEEVLFDESEQLTASNR